MATLKELETYYTMDQLADMHEAMDLQDEFAARAEARAKADAERKRRR